MNVDDTTIPVSVRARWLAWRDELYQIRQNESLRRAVEARADLCRVGVAMAFAREFPRSAIVRIGNRANRCNYLYARLFRELDIREPFDMEGREHLDAALAKGRGAIVVPAHFGRYRSIPQALFDMGCAVTLLVDAPSTEALSELIQRPTWQRACVGVVQESFAVASSRDVSSLWSLARALASGRVVVAFADGNAGMNGYAHDSGSIRLPFLGRVITARTGIAGLAAYANVPMIPVRARERLGKSPVLCFAAPIQPEADEGKKAFRERGTLALHAWLEQCIRESPAHWEEWSTFAQWVIPCSSPVETHARRVAVPLTLPALAGKSIALASPCIWVSSARGKRAILDVETLQWLTDDPQIVDLALAAETGVGALKWANQYANTTQALDVLARAMLDGIVALVR